MLLGALVANLPIEPRASIVRIWESRSEHRDITDAMKERGLRSPWVPEWSRLGASHSYTQEDGRPLWIDSTSGSTFIVAAR
jgi:hypothetical protein